MRSQFIDRWTRSERAVAVDICDRGPGSLADANVVHGVRASGPYHENRRRSRPSVLKVDERASYTAHDEVQVACEGQKTCGRSLSIDGHGLCVPSLSRSANAGTIPKLWSMPWKGFALPVLSTNAGAVDVPVFSM